MKVQVELIVDKILKALKVSVLVESFLLLLFDKMFFKVLTLPPPFVLIFSAGLGLGWEERGG